MEHLRVLATHSRSATPFRKTSARPVRAKAFESTVDMAWTRHGHSGDAVDVAWTSTRLGPAPRRTAAFATHPASLRALASKRICHCWFLDVLGPLPPSLSAFHRHGFGSTHPVRLLCYADGKDMGMGWHEMEKTYRLSPSYPPRVLLQVTSPVLLQTYATCRSRPVFSPVGLMVSPCHRALRGSAQLVQRSHRVRVGRVSDRRPVGRRPVTRRVRPVPAVTGTG